MARNILYLSCQYYVSNGVVDIVSFQNVSWSKFDHEWDSFSILKELVSY